MGVDYLGSGGAGLLIATQKLMSEEKSEETEQQTGSVPLVTANTSRKIKAKGRQKKKSPRDIAWRAGGENTGPASAIVTKSIVVVGA